MRVLLLGGTRNLGPDLVAALLARGDAVTVLHRGVTPFAFPPEVGVLHADRTDADALRRALRPGAGGAQGAKTRVPEAWDLTVDTTLYTGAEAEAVTAILRDRTGRYVALSTGQVYLVRTGIARPFREADYEGPLMAEPRDAAELPDWRYGIGKRAAEDALFAARRAHGFPAVTLRLPMINSRRDHYGRLRNLIARIGDGEPLLVPAGPHLALRHVYGDDVIQAILRAADERAGDERAVDGAAVGGLAAGPGEAGAGAAGAGEAWNISQPESIALEEFLALLARLLGRTLRTAAIAREVLAASGLLRAAAPFSDPWMSALDPTRSVAELGMRYTPVEEYLPRLVEAALAEAEPPAGYAQRRGELELLRSAGAVVA